MDKALHPLYQFIDKVLADSNYVIVDPLDPQGLLYLTPKDYRESMRTWIRSGTQIVVLHNPTSERDKKRLLSKDNNSASSSDNKTNPLSKGYGRILSKRTVLTNMLKASWDDIKMISLANSNGLGLLRFYLRIAIPLSLGKTYKDVPGKMWISLRFILFLKRMYLTKGPSYTVTYLKLSQLAISRAVGKQPLESLMELDSTYIHRRLSRKGLPVFIPGGDRRRILNGSTRTIRFWLTLFGLYRILKSPSIPKLSTITAPLEADRMMLVELMKFFYSNSAILLSQFYKSDFSDLIVRTWTNFQTASANSEVSWTGLLSAINLMERKYPKILKSIKDYCSLTQLEGSIISSLMITYDRIKSYISDTKSVLSLKSTLRLGPSVGRLSCKIEPAGKVRVFAMVDVLTQNVLKPLHLVLSRILKSIPNDGTFDQESMVNRAAKKAELFKAAYCYDLSAATDRLPILIQRSIVSSLFGRRLASLWQYILVGRPYVLPDNKTNRIIFKDDPGLLGKGLTYTTGQPMGALSSFNMLGLTHHLIVQFCARMICKGRSDLTTQLFENNWCIAYEILGDDIAIFHPLLAQKYLEVMNKLGVSINVKKSVIDVSGKTLELAKRTIHNGKDVSAISFKDILSSAPFAQRVAIVDRVTRRGTMSIPMAIQITTGFYGESPFLRTSYMLIALFFKAYHDKKVSIYDVFFLLFLLKRNSPVPGGSRFSYSHKIIHVLFKVINDIYVKNVTSYNTGRNSVFSENLMTAHITQFLFALYAMMPDFHLNIKMHRNAVGELLESVEIVNNRMVRARFSKLESNYLFSLFGQTDDTLSREVIIPLLGHLYDDDPAFSLFKDLAGQPKIREVQNMIYSNDREMHMLRMIEPHSEYSGLIDHYNSSVPRVPSSVEVLDLSSLDDMVFLMEKLTSAEIDAKIYEGPQELESSDYSPLGDFTRSFDKLDLSLRKVNPTLECKYQDVQSCYDSILGFLHLVKSCDKDLIFIPAIEHGGVLIRSITIIY